MNQLATMAVAAGATTIVVALVVWWIVKTVRDGEQRAAHWQIEARVAQGERDAAKKTAEVESDARRRLEESYADLNAKFVRLASIAVVAASDADAVRLAGGDGGPNVGRVPAAHPGRGHGGGDGLLEPDWETDPRPGAGG